MEQERKKVYDVSEIQTILGIGRNKIYEYLDEVSKTQEPFIVIKIGKLYKIPKQPFDRWISGEFYYEK